MLKIVLYFIVSIAVVYIPLVQASSIVKISSLTPPVWVHQNGAKTEIDEGFQLGTSRRLITGANARLEFQLEPEILLQLNSNSSVTYHINKISENSAEANSVELSIQAGTVCLHSPTSLNQDYRFEFNIAEMLKATVRHSGNTCVTRAKRFSSVHLWLGSVQISPTIEKNTIILSEAGTEFRLADNGKFEILTFDTANSVNAIIAAIGEPIEVDEIDSKIVSIPEPTVASSDKANELSLTVEVSEQADDGASESETAPLIQKTSSEFEYTVYLFSTRSKEVAENANKKFQKAGYETRIYEHLTDDVIRYRIVMPGFESRRSAQDFSESIIGRFDIGSTWIGKSRRDAN